MSYGMGREFTYLSSHATNRYFIPNWGNIICYITNRDKINNTDTLSNNNEAKKQFKVK